MKLIRATLAAAVAAATALPLGAEAASSSQLGAGTITTPVNLNFNVVIPRFVFLRVGDAGAVHGQYADLLRRPSRRSSTTRGVLATGGDVAGLRTSPIRSSATPAT